MLYAGRPDQDLPELLVLAGPSDGSLVRNKHGPLARKRLEAAVRLVARVDPDDPEPTVALDGDGMTRVIVPGEFLARPKRQAERDAAPENRPEALIVGQEERRLREPIRGSRRLPNPALAKVVDAHDVDARQRERSPPRRASSLAAWG
jgi:hypothetical protein